MLEANEYKFLSNDPLNAVDVLGLCGNDTCGQDVTDWLDLTIAHSINNDARVLDIKRLFEGNALQQAKAYLDFAELVRTGGEFEFKTFLVNESAYTDGKTCPNTPKCSGYLTLCNFCYSYELPANIHFGAVGRAIGFSRGMLLGAADAANRKDNHGRPDPSHDIGAIEAGMDLIDEPGLGLCGALNRKQAMLVQALKRSCLTCSDTYSGPFE